MSTAKQASAERYAYIARGKKPLTHRQKAEAALSPLQVLSTRMVNGVPVMRLADEVSPRRPNVGYDDGYECGTAVDGIW